MTDRRRLDELLFDTPGVASVVDDGDQVELWAYTDYGDAPATINADQVAELRDWLTAWLDSR
jgi:hypothetical protein